MEVHKMYSDSFLSEAELDQAAGKKQSYFINVMRRVFKNPVSTGGLVVFIVIALMAIFAPIIAPYNYMEMNPSARFLAPSWKHLCGTDDFGRDIFSRLLYGARYSLCLGLGGQIFQLTFGVLSAA